MKRYLPFLLLLASCGSVRNSTPSPIGLLPLYSYANRMGAPADTTYLVYRSAEDFDAAFLQQQGTARKPDFSGQTVVAMVLPMANERSALLFKKAEIVDRTMNVYAESCVPAPGTGCVASASVLATTPRSGNVRKVQFFVNGVSRRFVDL